MFMLIISFYYLVFLETLAISQWIPSNIHYLGIERPALLSLTLYVYIFPFLLDLPLFLNNTDPFFFGT